MNIHGLTLPPRAVKVLGTAMRGLSDLGIQPYPWSELRSGVRLVGYGSLLDPQSAARTLTTPGEERSPVVAFGVHRIFDYEIPESAFQHYGRPPEARARAALNIRVTGQLTDAVNGILFNVSDRDMEALRRREIDYDLAPVICMPWGDPEGPMHNAHILTCRQRPLRAVYEREALLPHPSYYQVCRRGAALVSDSFLQFFLSSTFLADGITPVAAWERQAFPEGFARDGPG